MHPGDGERICSDVSSTRIHTTRCARGYEIILLSSRKLTPSEELEWNLTTADLFFSNTTLVFGSAERCVIV